MCANLTYEKGDFCCWHRTFIKPFVTISRTNQMETLTKIPDLNTFQNKPRKWSFPNIVCESQCEERKFYVFLKYQTVRWNDKIRLSNGSIAHLYMPVALCMCYRKQEAIGATSVNRRWKGQHSRETVPLSLAWHEKRWRLLHICSQNLGDSLKSLKY